MSKPKFTVAAPYLHSDVIRFVSSRFDYVDTPKEADYIFYTGGADINPALYGEKPHPSTHFDRQRDEIEIGVFNNYSEKKHIGICRGFQLLHVLHGGRLRQHVDKHHGRHFITFDEKEYEVNSIHHQSIQSDGNAWIIGRAAISTFYETESKKKIPIPVEDLDPEIAIFGRRAFGVQFHPEWCSESELLFWKAFDFWENHNRNNRY